MHGVVTGGESRQQLYTMLTRGRSANHIYVSVVGDGDPHTLIRPDTILPSTATELLEQILARDGSPRSASTLLESNKTRPSGSANPSGATSTPCTPPPRIVLRQWRLANRLLPGLSDEPAWPTLRLHR